MTLLQAGNKRRKLQKAWNERMKLRAEGDKLWAEGNKLWAEGNKLRAEGDKLRAEGNKLYAEGNLVFRNAVRSAYGNVEIKWEGDDAIVEGVRYLGGYNADA
jgi:hypothetical protein